MQMMMQPKSLIFKLVSITVNLALLPFVLFGRFCIFCVRSFFIVIQTWIEVLRDSVYLHIHLIWSTIIWTFAFLSLPSRILNALQRERMLQIYVLEMQVVLENLVWDRKELEEQLNTAREEQKIMEVILSELEEEHDQAMAKIQLLETQLQDYKEQNLRLMEIRHKSSQESIIQLRSDQKPKYGALKEPKRRFETQIQPGSEPVDLHFPNPTQVLYRRREAAISQTFFSAILSLIVGVIVLEAEDHCMPLIVALFTVVGMSLKSVVQFFFTIKNKPASDAVALISFNWFILGTLTYPTLPRAASIFMPYFLRFSVWTARLLGLYS